MYVLYSCCFIHIGLTPPNLSCLMVQGCIALSIANGITCLLFGRCTSTRYDGLEAEHGAIESSKFSGQLAASLFCGI